VRNTDAEGARTLSGRAGGHKVIGPGPISAIVLNGPRYVAAHVAPCSESLDTVRYRSVAVSVLPMTWLRWCSRSEALDTAPLEPWQSRFVHWSWYRRLLQIGGRLLRLSRMAPPQSAGAPRQRRGGSESRCGSERIRVSLGTSPWPGLNRLWAPLRTGGGSESRDSPRSKRNGSKGSVLGWAGP